MPKLFQYRESGRTVDINIENICYIEHQPGIATVHMANGKYFDIRGSENVQALYALIEGESEEG